MIVNGNWTGQKIEVHGFICLLAFLLVMVASKKAREIEKLSAIRLATFIESPLQKVKGLNMPASLQ